MATFVLIHGAFGGGWRWEKVIPLLEQAGHKVIAPDLPGHGEKCDVSTEGLTLKSYTDFVSDILDKQTEPVILVGHSMGGLIVSQTAEYRTDKIKKLVYVCAFLLKDGQSLRSKGGGHHDPINAPYEVFKETFYGDCSDDEAMKARSRLVPEKAAVIGATTLHITEGNYGRIPRVYIECLLDNAIKPAVQKEMYTEMPCQRVISMEASHSPQTSRPEELARNLLSVLND
jgi:pimeloyl-ACP methyl ester carboxylesterase